MAGPSRILTGFLVDDAAPTIARARTAVAAAPDRVPVKLTVGRAAVWEPGESHETRSVAGMTALVVEGDITLA